MDVFVGGEGGWCSADLLHVLSTYYDAHVVHNDPHVVYQALLTYEEEISGSTEQAQAITLMIGMVACHVGDTILGN